MKRAANFLGIIAIVTVIGIFMTACADDSECMFSDWADKTPATCTAPLIQERVCPCGKSETRDVGSPLPHDWNLVLTGNPTICTLPNFVERVCRRCNTKETNPADIQASHDLSTDWVLINHATTKTEGEEAKVCLRTGCTHISETRDIAIIPPLINLTEVAAYLSVRTGTIENPLPMAMNFNIDVSLLQVLFITIADAGKYIDLDLSLCTMTGTDFIPGIFAEGKNRIVSLTLPDAALSTSVGSSFASAYLHFNNLSSITGENITTIGISDFQGRTNLTEVNFPNLITINGYSFQGCTSFEEIELPATLTSIGANAFANSSSLQIVVIRATTPPVLANANAFASTHADLQIRVPAASVDTYKAAAVWSALADKITAIP